MTDEPTMIWVKSDVTPEGTYIVSVEVDDDLSIPLPRDAAIRYAMALITAGENARYDAAVLKQITRKMDIPLREAIEVVVSMREDRPPLDPADTAPLTFAPGVTSKLDPYIGIHLPGRQIGQFTPTSASEHALYVLQVIAGADLDAAYHRWLTSTGADDNRIRGAVADLINWRTPDEPESEAP
jgi:hypothetical protein